MLSRLTARIVQCLLVILAAATFAFICMRLAPGDAATALGEQVPVELKAHMRELYALDQSAGTQYLNWLTSMLRGDAGWSIQQNRSVALVIREALGHSLMLIVPAFILGIVGGVWIGTWQALRNGLPGDRMVSRLALTIYSIPEFWLALALMMFFAQMLRVLPAGGITSDVYAYMSVREQVIDRLRHLILPVLSVALIIAATFARYQRSVMLDTLHQPFIRTAHASGLNERRVMRGALRASLTPALTLAGILLPSALAGVVFVEQIFAWPGLGYTMLRAINSRDQAVVVACVIVGSAFTALGALAAELLREWIDPRLRRQ